MYIYGGRDGTDGMMASRASVCTSPRQVGSRSAEVWLGLEISGCQGVRLWPYQERLIRFSDPIAAMLYNLFLFLDFSMAIPCSFYKSPSPHPNTGQASLSIPTKKVPTAGQPDRPSSPRHPRRAPGSPHGCLHPRILGITGRSAHCC